MNNKPIAKFRFACALALLAGFATGASAQIVYGHHYVPHYWDLPTEFDKPFNFPGQTLLFNSSRKAFDNSGKRVDTGVPVDVTFGFTILPHFFKFSPNSDWAYAFSLNTYELAVSADGKRVSSGVGNIIPAFTGWTKPTKTSTLGYDILLGTPFAFSKGLDSHTWDLYLRGFYDLNVNNFNIESVVGYHTARADQDKVQKPKDDYHLNLRLGYDINQVTATGMRVTPYLSMDYQRNSDDSVMLFNGGFGVKVTHKDGLGWSVGTSKSIKGKNAPETNALLAQVWIPF